MKDLHNYLVEKLKLSDVKVRRPECVDANKLKEKDLEAGNIVLIKNGTYYILAEDYIASPLVSTSLNRFNGDYILIRKNEDNPWGYSYLSLTEDYKNFPKCEDYEEFDIEKVYTRKKDYKDSNELKKDLDLLHRGILK